MEDTLKSQTSQDHSVEDQSRSRCDLCYNANGIKPTTGLEEKNDKEKTSYFRAEIVWRNVVLFTLLHVAAVVGFYSLLFQARLGTWIWTFVLHVLGGLSITIGAHRLWSHRSFKASSFVRTLLMLCNCIAVQNHVIEWARDHRVHHKFSETDADPHNAKRGFFFSHMGWLLMKKHPDVKRKGATVDVSDLESDPILHFQKRHYVLLAFLCSVLIPTLVPWFFWNESLVVAYFCAFAFRYVFTLHMTWTVNSFAHMFGYRPYDKYINPRQCLTSNLATLGEGWHNYHHTFPQDYRASEFPWRINLSTMVIDLFARLGHCWDLKTMPQDLIEKRKAKTGE